MEIPEINLISDFEAGITCLQNPSLLSRFFSLSGIEKVPIVYSFWKWGAVILVLLATLKSIIKRIRLIFIYLYSVMPSPQSFIRTEVFDFSEEDDDSSSISSQDEEEEDENIETTPFPDVLKINQDFCVKRPSLCTKGQWENGNLRYRRRRSSGCESFAWSNFTSGKNVVKLWDGLGLGLNFVGDDEDIDSKRVVSVWDFEKNTDSFGENWNIPAVKIASPTVVLTAERNRKRDGVVLGAHDTRMRRGIPAAYAEWGPTTAASSPAVDVAGRGIEKVYVRDDVNRVLTVGDMRNLRTPVKNVTESNGEIWWDADAITVAGELELVDVSS